ncbi:MAG: DNA polymerase III subunit delta [Candidatus Gracilibacteria bacterium]|nr:DNA polymerase III subunit delta [Candidatus Gracilibacteria bacterium]
MIYLFTGNSSFLIDDAVKKWKNQFIEKYGDFNLLQIKELDENILETLHQNMLSEGFMGEKKLIIIELNSDLEEKIQEFILKNIISIPENNMILFSYPQPDKRLKLYKQLYDLSQVKEFDSENEQDVEKIISARYKNITTDALRLLIRYKANNTQKIVNEIEKLSILYENIDVNHIKNIIMPELEENIFLIIDDILNKNIIDSLKKIDTILNQVNIYAFYNNLIANLRTSVFIMKLKKENRSQAEITNILGLGNKSFLINKKYNINFEKLEKIYIDLVKLDKKIKSGKLLGTEEDDFRFELEKCILKIA